VFRLLLHLSFQNLLNKCIDFPSSQWTIFLPCRGDNNRKAIDAEVTPIDRQCYAVILLAVSLLKGVGRSAAITIIATTSIPKSDFITAATHLEVLQEWNSLADTFIHFKFLSEVSAGLRSAYSRSVNIQMRSLIILSHGDCNRMRICLDGQAAFLNAAKVQNHVEVSKCHVAHLMACKARKIAVSITETKSLKNNCLADETLFIAYGEDDITTIPYQFGTGQYIDDT
jgi:hypothetical protein